MTRSPYFYIHIFFIYFLSPFAHAYFTGFRFSTPVTHASALISKNTYILKASLPLGF